MSRSEVNQTTAKASLTQMLNVVFQRMEAGSQHVVVPPIAVTDVLGLPSVDVSSMTAFVQGFLHEVVTQASCGAMSGASHAVTSQHRWHCTSKERRSP